MALGQLRHFEPGLSRLRLTQPNQSLKNRRNQIFADVKLSFCFLLIFYERGFSWGTIK
jgi:hypothetical protein